jgi:3',5'-cyclic AMP phosphodiesterase CpdA
MRKKDQATTLQALLRTDIKSGLQLNKLNFLVISGDVAAYSTPDEYEAALDLVFGVARDFDVDPSRIVVVPGNHDLNYESSRETYKFLYKQDLPGQLADGTYYLAGEEGVLVRDDELYGSRFAHFFSHFYNKIAAREYALSSNEQATLYKYEKERILILGLNSCSEIDHHFEKRAKIDEVALSETLGGFHAVKENVKDWLKVAVCHHPVTGSEQMNETGFLKLLAAEGFNILMHGHTHKADTQTFNNSQENIQTIGAGTFGARADELVTARPWQYNLLTFDPATRTITVDTRKREELFGPWGPDSRWGNDPNQPLPYYRIEL